MTRVSVSDNRELTRRKMNEAIDFVDGITATVADLNRTPQLAGRNLIINGSGRINQRDYVSGTATTSANQYTLDRWRVVTSGQSLTFTGDDSARTMTAPAGGAEQVIEGANIVGGTYVISFAGTATCTVDGVTRASGADFTLTANTNATVRFTGGTFTDVQVELGSAATPFEWRDYGSEEALCQRYFQRTSVGIAGAAVKTTIAAMSYTPLVKFRVPPSLSLSAAAKVDWPYTANYLQSSINITAIFNSEKAVNFALENFSGLTVHSHLVMRSDGGAVSMDAEL